MRIDRVALGVALSLLAPALACAHNTTAERLSIPTANDTSRAERVEQTAERIANEPRWATFDDETHVGTADLTLASTEVGVDGSNSLYAQILQEQESLLVAAQKNPVHANLSNAMKSRLPLKPPTDIHEYHRVYLQLPGRLSWPTALINLTDESFAEKRLGAMGHNLALVQSGEYIEVLNQLTTSLAKDVCAQDTIEEAVGGNAVYAADFKGMGQYSAVGNGTTQKYIPDVIGFFCENRRNATAVLLPLAIYFPSTNLVFTKNDAAGDWTLAKMALDATELNYQYVKHYVEVRKIVVPIQVAMLRTMARQHPVHALLWYHWSANFALEKRLAATLFHNGSDFDATFAIGAAGAQRFASRMMGYRVNETLRDELERKGFKNLAYHRLHNNDVNMLSNTITEFVRAYIATFYANESAIQSDQELQRWAAQASKLRNVQGFPEHFAGFTDLTSVLTNLVFQSTVRHHMLHGPWMWDSFAAPYSTPALWNKPLPKAKNTGVNPLDYAMSPDLLPALVSFAARGIHDLPANISILNAYNISPFIDEPKLTEPIAAFRKSMKTLEDAAALERRIPASADPHRHIVPSQMSIYPIV